MRYVLAWREGARRISELWAKVRSRVANLCQRLYWDLRDASRGPNQEPGFHVARFRILFVCLGNICRSPLAEEIFRQKVARTRLAALIAVDSAGTTTWNIGRRPHWKARACAVRHGLDIGHLRARLFTANDFDDFDRIVVMDEKNMEDVLRFTPQPPSRAQVHFLLDFAGGGQIPDPIDGDAAAFETVFTQIDAACEGLLASVVEEIGGWPAAVASPPRP